MQTIQRHIEDRLGSALYRLTTLEQRVNEAAESPRGVGKLLGDVRKMIGELQRSFVELQDLVARSTLSERSAATALARANLLFDLSPVACLVLEPMGLVLDANGAASRFLNISHRHLIGKSFPLFVAADRDGFLQRIRHLPAEATPERWNAALRPRERSAVQCVIVAAPDPEGRVLLMVLPGASIEPAADPEPTAEE
jgi:PAS domain-containing protein